jgi:hypothetical protein
MPTVPGLPTAAPKDDICCKGTAPKRMEKHQQMIADIWGGTETMRIAAKRWLPQEPGETAVMYGNRVNRSTFYNGYKRAVKNLAGKPFTKAFTYANGLDKVIKDQIFVDIDRSGRHLEVFANDFLVESLKDGLRAILIEYPDTSQVSTLEQERKLGNRFYFIEIDPRQIIAFRYKIEGGKFILLHFRYKEIVTEAVGDWGEQQVEQIRVLEPGRWQVWRQKKDIPGLDASTEAEKQTWAPYDYGRTSLDVVPIVVYYTGRINFLDADPPMLDLAYLNVQHWQSSSDQAHILHVARVPILFGSGWANTDSTGEKKGVMVSPNAMITNPNVAAKLEYVEHHGYAITSGEKDIENIENRMAVMGVQLLIERPGKPSAAKTATQVLGETESDYSDLGIMVRNLEDALEAATSIGAKYQGIKTPDGRYISIYKDFGITLRDAADLQTLLDMRAEGQITQETFLLEMKRRGIFGPDFDVEAEIEKVRLEPPSLLNMPVPPISTLSVKPEPAGTPPGTGTSGGGEGGGGRTESVGGKGSAKGASTAA